MGLFCSCSKKEEEYKGNSVSTNTNRSRGSIDHSVSESGSYLNRHEQSPSIRYSDIADMSREDSYSSSSSRSGSSRSGRRGSSKHSGSSLSTPKKKRKGHRYHYPRNRPQNLTEYPDLFKDTASFLRTLPAVSKGQIWDHACSEKNAEGKKIPKLTCESQKRVSTLMCDVVIVFLKYCYKKTRPYSTDVVLPWVKDLSRWLHEKHPVINKSDFTDRHTFSVWIETYINSQ